MTEIHSYFADEIFRIGTELQWIVLSCNEQNIILHNCYQNSPTGNNKKTNYLNFQWQLCEPVYQSGIWACGLLAASSPGPWNRNRKGITYNGSLADRKKPNDCSCISTIILLFWLWQFCLRLHYLWSSVLLFWCWSDESGLEGRRAGGDTEGQGTTNPEDGQTASVLMFLVCIWSLI